MKNNTVMLFGTFDLLHPGHKNLIKQARQLGRRIIVVVARDRTVFKVKGRLPRHDENRRKQEIEKTNLVELVVLGNLTNRYGLIKKFKPDIICLGYDQRFFTAGLRNFLTEANLGKTRIVRLKAYKPGIYKTSKLLNK